MAYIGSDKELTLLQPEHYMKYNPDKHHRRSIRLPGYDYASEGWYFITICVQDKRCIFGEIRNHKMVMNNFGLIVDMEWKKTAQLRKNINLDAYIIMPNHIHGVIVLNDKYNRWGTMHRAPTMEQFGKPVSGSIPTIIRSFKSAVTKQINKIQNTPGLHLWQRNYYEHNIRSENDLNRIRTYIIENPLKWTEDKYYSKISR